MKKIKYLLVIVLFFICRNAYAIDDCSTSEMQRLKELANNVDIKYETKIEEVMNQSVVEDILVSYSLKIANYNDDLRLYYKLGNEEKKLTTVQELESLIFYEGNNIQIQVYSWTNNLCTNEILRTITLKLPMYSRFYYLHKEECSKYPDFKYCKEFINSSSLNFDDDIDKVEEAFNNYKKNNNVISVDDDIKVNSYYLIGAGALLLMLLVISIIIINIKRRKKNDI